MNKYTITQNFLKNTDVIASIISKAEFKPEDVILDIGAGKGIITAELAKHSNKVIAIEADNTLSTKLREKFLNSSVTIINQDVLSYSFPNKPFYVVANIPFNITASILKKLLNKQNNLKIAYIILQKEAAEKFAGSQINLKSSLQSVLLSVDFKFEIIHKFSPYDFEPKPKVETVLLKISRRSIPLIDTKLYTEFADFISYIFSNSKPYIQTCTKLFSFIQFQKFEKSIKLKPNSTPSEVKFDVYKNLFEYMKKSDKDKVKVFKGFHYKISTEQNSLEKINRTRVRGDWREQIKKVDRVHQHKYN